MLPEVKRLESGYWFVRWNAEVWAQWPCQREVLEDDFFHHTGTPDRIKEAHRLTASAPPASAQE